MRGDQIDVLRSACSVMYAQGNTMAGLRYLTMAQNLHRDAAVAASKAKHGLNAQQRRYVAKADVRNFQLRVAALHGQFVQLKQKQPPGMSSAAEIAEFEFERAEAIWKLSGTIDQFAVDATKHCAQREYVVSGLSANVYIAMAERVEAVTDAGDEKVLRQYETMLGSGSEKITALDLFLEAGEVMSEPIANLRRQLASAAAQGTAVTHSTDYMAMQRTAAQAYVKLASYCVMRLAATEQRQIKLNAEINRGRSKKEKKSKQSLAALKKVRVLFCFVLFCCLFACVCVAWFACISRTHNTMLVLFRIIHTGPASCGGRRCEIRRVTGGECARRHAFAVARSGRHVSPGAPTHCGAVPQCRQ
jgi:hypothetical protein